LSLGRLEMTQVTSCFTASATVLERDGEVPLVAVELYTGGRLASAAVVDLSAGWPYGDVPGWAIPSRDPADTRGGGR
jgi:hypothetical protein